MKLKRNRNSLKINENISDNNIIDNSEDEIIEDLLPEELEIQ